MRLSRLRSTCELMQQYWARPAVCLWDDIVTDIPNSLSAISNASQTQPPYPRPNVPAQKPRERQPVSCK